MKLHSRYRVAAVVFHPVIWKSVQSKAVVDLTTYRINDNEYVAVCPTPPTWDGVVAGEFNLIIRATPNPSRVRAPLFGDDGPCGFPSINIFDRVIAELWARFLCRGGESLPERKQTACEENDKSHRKDSGTFSFSLQRKALAMAAGGLVPVSGLIRN